MGRLSSQRPRFSIKLHLRVVARRQRIRANLLRDDQQLIELQMVVAKAARNGRASGKILLNERTHHIALKALLVIDHVVGDADGLGDAARVVNIIQRATASLHRLGHALMAGQAALVPELHGQANDFVALGAQHGRDGGGVNSTGHGDGNGCGAWSL